MATRDRTDSRGVYGPILFLLILTACIVAAAYFYYSHYEKRYMDKVKSELSSIADLKVSELTQWRKERLGDGAIFFRNENFSTRVRRFLEAPGDADAQEQLRTWFRRVREAYGYDRIFLLDARGVQRIAVPDTPEPTAPHLARDAAEILRSGKVTFLDFHRDVPDGPIRLSVLVPIFDPQEGDRLLGVLVLRINPEHYLYPFINRWPIPSRTAETLLTRREGNDIVFLSKLRFQENAALNLRIPITRQDLPSVKAAQGWEGIMKGRDYRGVPVLAAVRVVPNSPWFLIARIDISEAYAPIRETLWMTVILVGALLASAAAGIGLVWHYQRSRFYREQYRRELAPKWRISP